MTKTSSKVVIVLILLLSLLSVSIAQEDAIALGKSINDSTTLVSSGGSFILGFFSPGNSKNRYLGIWYNKISVRTYVWVANRERPLSDSTGVVTISSNGSLILTNVTGSVFWSTPATNGSSPAAQLLDTGNLVVLDADNNGTGDYGWQSFDYPTDTMLPGFKLGWDLRKGLNRYLTPWKGNDDPARGDHSVLIDIRGVPQIFKLAGSVREWRTGPWVGGKFTGIPDMVAYNIYTFNFVANSNEVSYEFDMLKPSILSKIMLNQSGILERQAWIELSGAWKVFWYVPKDDCDNYRKCGDFGVCDANNPPICNCLQGFIPKSPSAWNLRDNTDGCVRKTQLDCRNGTDGFNMLSNAKLPDTSNATLNRSMALDDCRIACLSNCSCSGYSSADARGGNGCIFWYGELTDIKVHSGGQDLFVRMAAADLEMPSEQSGTPETTIIIVSVVLGTLLLGLIGIYSWRRLKTKKRGLFSTTTRFIEDMNEDTRVEDFELPLFDMVTVEAATDNFSSENKLGEGGFGPVYKGRLAEGQDIAVKRLSKTSLQGVNEFKNEVSSIAKLQHRNLVRLLGCCIEGRERLLIYEYMSNNSLDALLFDKSKGAQLNWQRRYSIIVGIARGLLYLHQDSRFRIIHRDLKVSNILLDKKMNPKISDFGLARIFESDVTEAKTRKVVGTYGYMSPEYAMDGIFSVKSDVFSFGVIVLEIICGKKNRGSYNSDHQNLLSHAWNLWKEGNGLQLVDESMGFSYPIAEAMRCITMGLLCVQERPEERPTMSSVVVMLTSDDKSLPQPRQPGFARTNNPVEAVHSSSSKQDLNTVNDVTVTLIEGR